MEKTSFNFSGRPDGIGNRIEEIITLQAISEKTNLAINYVWRNELQHRNYDILFTSNSPNVSVAKKEDINIPHVTSSEFKNVKLSQHEILESARKIIPSFNLIFETNIKPVGIHIRGTDRINDNNHPHFMRNQKEFLSYLSNTIALINKECPQYVFVCSDNENYRNQLVINLNRNISVVEPVCDKNIPSEYSDFFALTKCDRVYMCSKFSSFAITAALIGNIPIVSFHFDQEVAVRYKALFRYEPIDSGLKMISSNGIKKTKNRISTICKTILSRISSLHHDRIPRT